ncbi:MAG: uracil-DNA glycosylase [Burkholderiales bacterium]
MNRDAVLAELGLGPIWKLRRAPQADGGRAPPADAAVPDRTSNIAGLDWPELATSVAACTACGLCGSRKNTVFGVGNRQAAWMIVGEAPGAEEDERGEPFVGQAGRLLDAMLAALALKRERDVYIANVLKCRPPGNRNPAPEEVARCAPYLTRQVALIKPRLLVLMGRFAAQTLLESEASIASMRGRVHQVGATPAIVTYHPAYLLRTPLDKARAWEDMLFARAVDRRLQSGRAAST